MKNPFLALIVTIAVLFSIAISYYLLFLNHVSINEIGIAYDSTTGEIHTQPPGWHHTGFLTRATTISTLPFKVEISYQGYATRVLNVHLVRFVPEHIEDFIKMNGFEYYGNSTMSIVMMPYVFSGKSYPFLEVLQ